MNPIRPIIALLVLILLSFGVYVALENNKNSAVDYNEFIKSASFTPDCHIKIITYSGIEFIGEQLFWASDTNKGSEACVNTTRVLLISPDRQYVVYEDLMGGVDSALRVYSLEKEMSTVLDVVGTSSVYDYIFLPNNKLVALIGWSDHGDQSLVTYDIPALYRDFDKTYDTSSNYFKVMAPYRKWQQLAKKDAVYNDLEIVEDETMWVNALDSSGNTTKYHQGYSVSDF